MIACETASQTVNLYYSVIKFVTFKGIVWAGESLPLRLASLGDLYQVRATLTDRSGTRQQGVYWERGLLFGTFLPGKTYDLAMRLEYHAPPLVDVFACDFESIHPRAYSAGLDFAWGGKAEDPHFVEVKLGSGLFRFPIGKEEERRLDAGQRFTMSHRDDFCSASLENKAEAPFGHRHFPEFRLI